MASTVTESVRDSILSLARIAVAVFVAVLIVVSPAHASNVTVSWNQTYQTIVGFGAGCPWLPDMTDAQADLFFSTTSGAGLSLIRARVPTDGTVECGPTMQKAVARGARAWATPWTPPPSMKTNNNLNGGSLAAGSYQAYADYLTNYVKKVKSQYGVTLYALSVQNEPDYTSTYDTALWTGQNLHDFILNNLGPAFQANGITTKIMAPEESWWDFSLADATMQDPAAAQYVGIVASHNYNYNSPSVYPLAQGKEFWMSEISTIHDTFDGSIDNGLRWAADAHNWLTVANVNSWDYWWFWTLYNNDNQGLLDYNLKPAKRLWTMGNFARFVRPGFVRIAATPSPATGILVSAYKDPSTGKFALVAINQTSSSYTLSTQVDTNLTSVTPWRTSATEDLKAQAAILTSNGAFTATLPAKSVTTFVGAQQTGAPADTAAPSVPTGLSATANSATQITLSWSASTDNVGVTGYNVYRGGTKVGTSQGTSFTDTGLSAATTYSYTVDAYDAAGNVSAKSGTASAKTQAASDTSTPSTPTNVSATANSSTQITLSWRASSDNIGVAGYNVYRGGTKVAISQSTSYVDAGLTASTQYTYAVSAFDAAGNTSALSSTVSATTLSNTPQFHIGGKIKTTTKINAYTKTELRAKVRCTQPAGSVGDVEEGPVKNDGYTWWHIDYNNGCYGWTRQDQMTAIQ
ncbi:MAG TPA: fibronectin type III domain-containing protein [Candidatus Paceibacterota bacterium]|nr:fibronectin type III domain-containing protein [Candidatus Paceibacterota bacterium]